MIKPRTYYLLALAVLLTLVAYAGARDEDPLCQQSSRVTSGKARLVRVQDDTVATLPCPVSGLSALGKASHFLAFPAWVGFVLSLISDLGAFQPAYKKKKKRRSSSGQSDPPR